MHRSALACTIACLFGGTLAARAHAEGPRFEEQGLYAAAPQSHRSGPLLGLSLGMGAARFGGYPNDASKVDDDRYYSSVGLRPGVVANVLLMAALTDYLNVGLWFGFGGFRSKDDAGKTGGGGLRVEGYPLTWVSPKFRNLGFFGQFGVGSGSLKQKDVVTTEGTQSFFSFGSYYEFELVRQPGGLVMMGPEASLQFIDSATFKSQAFIVSLRFAFYGHVAPKPKTPRAASRRLLSE